MVSAGFFCFVFVYHVKSLNSPFHNQADNFSKIWTWHLETFPQRPHKFFISLRNREKKDKNTLNVRYTFYRRRSYTAHIQKTITKNPILVRIAYKLLSSE